MAQPAKLWSGSRLGVGAGQTSAKRVQTTSEDQHRAKGLLQGLALGHVLPPARGERHGQPCIPRQLLPRRACCQVAVCAGGAHRLGRGGPAERERQAEQDVSARWQGKWRCSTGDELAQVQELCTACKLAVKLDGTPHSCPQAMRTVALLPTPACTPAMPRRAQAPGTSAAKPPLPKRKHY